ncbi:MAG: protein phosphatase 2C domain-containing protein [Clostridia bacterium]
MDGQRKPHAGEDEPYLQECMVSVSYAAFAGQGEDSFAIRSDARGAVLCVADGCGGLGGKRYERLGNHTGAYLASRLVTRAFVSWAEERKPMPATAQEGQALCAELEGDLQGILNGFAQKNGCMDEPTRIVGSMQRLLPTTLCAAITEGCSVLKRECCFVWAGDSRGYVLDANGLHQCTQDHMRGEVDALESLYRDVPLSQLLCAELPSKLSMRRLTVPTPCIVLCATDGAFGCLSSPMEFEMLLLSTMLAANSEADWQHRLELALGRLAHDDATLLLQFCGFESYAQLKQHFQQRLTALKHGYITPIRRHRQALPYTREKWQEYREQYDRTEGVPNERTNWRI